VVRHRMRMLWLCANSDRAALSRPASRHGDAFPAAPAPHAVRNARSMHVLATRSARAAAAPAPAVAAQVSPRPHARILSMEHRRRRHRSVVVRVHACLTRVEQGGGTQPRVPGQARVAAAHSPLGCAPK
jgi:hypothetical protein